MEGHVRGEVNRQISRGKLSVLVSFDDDTISSDLLVLNQKLAETYYKMYSDLKRKLKLAGEIEIAHFVAFPDLFGVAPVQTASAAGVKRLITGVQKALVNLNKMRQREGKVLAADMVKRVTRISKSVDKVKRQQPKSLQQYRLRLNKRIKEILSGCTPFPKHDNEHRMRLDLEVAIMADKADVTEECVRLQSHCQAFLAAVRSRGDVGQKAWFYPARDEPRS